MTAQRRHKQAEDVAPSRSSSTSSGSGGAPWDLSRPDWEARIAAGESLLPDLPHINRSRADRAVAIFSRLVLPDSDERPLPRLGDAAGPWFIEIVRALFGSWDPVARQRYVRELFILVGKKNSKTTYSAGLLLTALLMNDRNYAEFLFVAPTQDISDLAFNQAMGMIEADGVLRAKFQMQVHRKKLIYLPTRAFLKVKSFSPKVLTGSKPAGVLLDETHVIATSPDADRVLGQLRGGLVSQPEAFLIQITTQSERVPAGVFKAELAKARAVRDGKLKGVALLPVLYEFPKKVNWREIGNWHMVVPNNGRSISVDRLIPDYDQAVASGDAELRRWASQHLNVEIGMALRDDAWAGALRWQRQVAEDPQTVSLAGILGMCDSVAIGIDGGGAYDWLGLAVMGRRASDRHWFAWTRAWVSVEALDRFKGELQTWRDFEEAGDLVIVETLGQAAAQATQICKEVSETGLLVQIGADPEKTFAMIHDDLVAGGLPADKLIKVAQGWRLQGPMTVVERRLSDGTIWHSGSPMMAYCVGNAKLEIRPQSAVIAKHISGGKIDPLMALLDAAAVLNTAPPPICIGGMIG